VGERGLEIRQVGEHPGDLGQLPVRDRHHRPGLRLQRQGPRVGRLDLAQQRLGAVGERRGHPRVEHAPAAPPDRVDGRLDPAQGVEQHRDPAQPGQPGPGREVVAGQAGRGASSPPVLVDVVDAALDRLGQAQAPCRLPADLAGGGGVGLGEAAAFGDSGQDQPGPRERRPAPREQWQEGGEQVPGIGRVLAPGGHVEDELVPKTRAVSCA
jgi:hypothetical protein